MVVVVAPSTSPFLSNRTLESTTAPLLCVVTVSTVLTRLAVPSVVVVVTNRRSAEVAVMTVLNTAPDALFVVAVSDRLLSAFAVVTSVTTRSQVPSAVKFAPVKSIDVVRLRPLPEITVCLRSISALVEAP